MIFAIFHLNLLKLGPSPPLAGVYGVLGTPDCSLSLFKLAAFLASCIGVRPNPAGLTKGCTLGLFLGICIGLAIFELAPDEHEESCFLSFFSGTSDFSPSSETDFFFFFLSFLTVTGVKSLARSFSALVKVPWRSVRNLAARPLPFWL